MYHYANNNYNSKLQLFAKKLRGDMTKAEACLWKYTLSGRKMKGYMFRRQRPIFSYIADFVCLELKLIIEADGVTHHFAEVVANDEIRQKELKDAGYKVIRFNDDEILSRMHNVTQAILVAIEDIEQSKNL